MAVTTHMMSDETGQEILEQLGIMNGHMAVIADATRDISIDKVLEYDDTAGEYKPESIARMFRLMATGLIYGVNIPKSASTVCTKVDSNAGIPAPVTSTLTKAGSDPYRNVGPFCYVLANCTVDADGVTHVQAIQGDGMFKMDGSNGDVFQLHPIFYYIYDDSFSDYIHFAISDSIQQGFVAAPGTYMPDGSKRPFLSIARYPGYKKADGSMGSASGKPLFVDTVSHNSGITICKTATTGYSLLNHGELFYLQAMFLIKYATKNSQSMFAGCTGYYNDVTVLEGSTTAEVLINASDASKFEVGSTIRIGASSFTDDILEEHRILSITDNDSSFVVAIDGVSAPESVAAGSHLSTAPWFTGTTDMVEGDGAMVEATNARYPYQLQGVECNLGAVEIIGNMILDSQGEGFGIYINHDSRNEATSLTDDYEKIGVLPPYSRDSWSYPTHMKCVDGYMFAVNQGGSQSTGMCDGTYQNASTTAGSRELPAFGHLGSGGNAGLWYLDGNGGLSGTWWRHASRLSLNGRSKGVNVA